MASGVEDVVPPTRVQLYHRSDDPASSGNQPHHSTLQTKTSSTAFTQTAFLVRTNSDRHEIQVFWVGPDTDAGGIGSVCRGSSPGGPPQQAIMAVDLKTARSCVFKSRDWIEITDSAGVCRAIEFSKEEPSFSTFYEKLTTILMLLKVKCSSKPTVDKENWVQITLVATRQLPPVPKKGATTVKKPSPVQLPSSDELDMYDECDSDRTLADWPKRAPPPPPSKKPPKQKERQLPGADDARLDPDYTPNSSASSTLSSGRGTLGPNTTHAEDDDDYLVPLVDRRNNMTYANDPPLKSAPQPPPKAKSGPKTVPKNVESSASGSIPESDWSCSACTLWNSSTDTRCKACDKPRRFEAAAGSQCRECSKERNNVKKGGTSYCQTCSSSNRGAPVSRSKSFDCIECRRLGHKASPGCVECSTTNATKSKPVACEECHRVGNRTPTECIQCRAAAGVKSNSADSDESNRRDREREVECNKNICIATINARDKPTRQTIVNRFPTPFTAAAAALPPAASIPSPPSSVNVDKWRCRKCTFLNPENVFYCSVCFVVRDDAWQCQVCDAVICLDIVRCQRCDVWKCRLCTFQNDERQQRSGLCQQCNQPQ